MHAVPDGRHDDYDFRTALLRQYSLAGALTAAAIALAVASPVLGKLVDKFGQRQVSIPTIIVWMIAATALASASPLECPHGFCSRIVFFMAAIPPCGAR